VCVYFTYGGSSCRSTAQTARQVAGARKVVVLSKSQKGVAVAVAVAVRERKSTRSSKRGKCDP
jgi:predicted ribosome-associated RNA-binding protein Tma20